MDQLQRIARLEKWLLVLFLVIIAMSIYFILAGSKSNTYNDQQLKVSIDSMRTHDKQMIIQVHQLEQIRSQDSTHIADIKDQLDDTKDMVNNINRKYAKERTTLANSSVDDRLRFLSGHLPKSDSNR